MGLDTVSSTLPPHRASLLINLADGLKKRLPLVTISNDTMCRGRECTLPRTNGDYRTAAFADAQRHATELIEAVLRNSRADLQGKDALKRTIEWERGTELGAEVRQQLATFAAVHMALADLQVQNSGDAEIARAKDSIEADILALAVAIGSCKRPPLGGYVVGDSATTTLDDVMKDTGKRLVRTMETVGHERVLGAVMAALMSKPLKQAIADRQPKAYADLQKNGDQMTFEIRDLLQTRAANRMAAAVDSGVAAKTYTGFESAIHGLLAVADLIKQPEPGKAGKTDPSDPTKPHDIPPKVAKFFADGKGGFYNNSPNTNNVDVNLDGAFDGLLDVLRDGKAVPANPTLDLRAMFNFLDHVAVRREASEKEKVRYAYECGKAQGANEVLQRELDILRQGSDRLQTDRWGESQARMEKLEKDFGDLLVRFDLQQVRLNAMFGTGTSIGTQAELTQASEMAIQTDREKLPLPSRVHFNPNTMVHDSFDQESDDGFYSSTGRHSTSSSIDFDEHRASNPDYAFTQSRQYENLQGSGEPPADQRPRVDTVPVHQAEHASQSLVGNNEALAFTHEGGVPTHNATQPWATGPNAGAELSFNDLDDASLLGNVGDLAFTTDDAMRPHGDDLGSASHAQRMEAIPLTTASGMRNTHVDPQGDDERAHDRQGFNLNSSSRFRIQRPKMNPLSVPPSSSLVMQQAVIQRQASPVMGHEFKLPPPLEVPAQHSEIVQAGTLPVRFGKEDVVAENLDGARNSTGATGFAKFYGDYLNAINEDPAKRKPRAFFENHKLEHRMKITDAEHPMLWPADVLKFENEERGVLRNLIRNEKSDVQLSPMRKRTVDNPYQDDSLRKVFEKFGGGASVKNVLAGLNRTDAIDPAARELKRLARVIPNEVSAYMAEQREIGADDNAQSFKKVDETYVTMEKMLFEIPASTAGVHNTTAASIKSMFEPPASSVSGAVGDTSNPKTPLSIAPDGHLHLAELDRKIGHFHALGSSLARIASSGA